jgi:uncharacterized surface protein with fasciclin (FAS1) repeats
MKAMTMKKHAMQSMAFALASAAVACGTAAVAAERRKGESKQLDIVETTRADGSFKILSAILAAAGLAETLKGDGPFTVFAPTDEAFAKLSTGTVESLLLDVPKLTSILTYHVMPGRLDAVQVAARRSVETVNGQCLDVSVDGDSVKVGDANVVKTDIAAANGIVHAIDTVLMPRRTDSTEAVR